MLTETFWVAFIATASAMVAVGVLGSYEILMPN